MKIFVCGHGRHGKDEFAERLSRETDLSYVSSSYFVARKVALPYLAKAGLFYGSVEECYDDRHNHRDLWYQSVREFNGDDLSRLSRAIFDSHDMYVGIRDDKEFLASKDLANFSFWVDASDRVEYRDPTCKITEDMCDATINNNGSLRELQDVVEGLAIALNVHRLQSMLADE